MTLNHEVAGSNPVRDNAPAPSEGDPAGRFLQPIDIPDVDRPAEDELSRAEDLAGRLYSRMSLAKHAKNQSVSLDMETAEELCQLLHDSIKTAKWVKRFG